LALSAHACPSGAFPGDWFASARACHAEPLAPGSSGSSRHWSRSAGWSPLVQLGPRHSPRSPLIQLGPRHSPRSAARVGPLVSAGSARAGWSSLCALVALLSLLVARPQVSRARLCRPPSVTLGLRRARIPLEFGCSRQFHTCGHLVLTVPRVQVKRRPSATGLLLRTHSAGPVSQTCLLRLLRRELTTRRNPR
jgi:hypothetical protein